MEHDFYFDLHIKILSPKTCKKLTLFIWPNKVELSTVDTSLVIDLYQKRTQQTTESQYEYRIQIYNAEKKKWVYPEANHIISGNLR